MRKKKLAIGKWVFSALVLVVIGLGYWLSLERTAPVGVMELPLELNSQPVQ